MAECREADMHRGVASPAPVRSEASLELAMPRIEVRLTLCRLGVECEIAIGEGVAEPRTVASAAELVAQAAKRPIDRVGPNFPPWESCSPGRSSRHRRVCP